MGDQESWTASSMSAAAQGRLVVMLQSGPDVEERNYSYLTQMYISI